MTLEKNQGQKADLNDKVETQGSEQGTVTKSRGIKRRVVLLSAVLIVAVFAFIDAHPFGPPEVSKETTVLTGPLTLDGNGVDYIAAVKGFVPANASTDENGARLLVQELGPDFFLCQEGLGSLGLVQRSKEMCDFFGLEQGDEPPVRFITPYDAYEAFLLDRYPGDENALVREAKQISFNQFSSRTEDVLAWDDDRVEFLEKWCAENQSAFDLISQAAHKEVFAFPALPYGRVEGVPFLALSAHGPIEGLRMIVRSLRIHANYCVRVGDMEKAIDDVETMLLLARHVINNQTNSLIPFIIGMGMQSAASDVNLRGNPDASPTKEHWQRIFAACGNPTYNQCFDQVLEIARYGVLDYLQTLGHYNLVSEYDRKANPPRKKNYLYRFLLRLRYDWNYVMKRANYLYDNSIELDSLLNNPQEDKRSFLERLPLKQARSETFVRRVLKEIVPIQKSAKDALNRYVCNVRMQKIVLAMQMYLCDHGTLPPAYTLDENGNRLHSWRTLLLPYLGEQELYDKIHLDEPWDSEYNRQFHTVDVRVYKCPALAKESADEALGEELTLPSIRPGDTSYAVVMGPNSLFDASGQGKDPVKLEQTESAKRVYTMALLVEQIDSVCWMKPDNGISEGHALRGINLLDTEEDNNDRSEEEFIHGLASFHKGGVNIALAGGAILFVPENIAYQELSHFVLGTEMESRDVLPETLEKARAEMESEEEELNENGATSAAPASESQAGDKEPASASGTTSSSPQAPAEGKDVVTNEDKKEKQEVSEKPDILNSDKELVKPQSIVPLNVVPDAHDLDLIKKDVKPSQDESESADTEADDDAGKDSAEAEPSSEEVPSDPSSDENASAEQEEAATDK
ncbi:MAG: DUF1559 domain-containing protein [Planctomycetia bacterium]|nr:DUF1559 domain-containing protein [Planctomycetia bacterium]